MHSPPRSAWALATRDGDLRGSLLIAVLLAFIWGFVLFVLWAILVLPTKSLPEVLAKVFMAAAVTLIGGGLLWVFSRRVVRSLSARIALLRDLAGRGVVAEATLRQEGWVQDSEGDRFWTATYGYASGGAEVTFRPSAGWSNSKRRFSPTLPILLDPKDPSRYLVLNLSRGTRMEGAIDTAKSALMILWIASWAVGMLTIAGPMKEVFGATVLVIAVFIPAAYALLWVIDRTMKRPD